MSVNIINALNFGPINSMFVSFCNSQEQYAVKFSESLYLTLYSGLSFSTVSVVLYASSSLLFSQ